MTDNHDLLTRGFKSLVKALAPYIARELQIQFHTQWWREGVLDALYEDQARDLPGGGEWAALVDSLDAMRCLSLFDRHWNGIFKKKLSIDHRNWAKELMGVRNKWAHVGGQDFTDDYAWRALDTMALLCEQIDAESAEEIRVMMRTLRYGSENGSAAATQAVSIPPPPIKSAGVLTAAPVHGLPGWREVIEPHPDVAQGRYKNAEFAADLAQVARGEGAYEYRDPVEFFARTYVTEGMKGLLTQALRRVAGLDGEPVIQLKTAFGGGKTHSMLALYHLLRKKVSPEKIPSAAMVLEAAGIASFPQVHVAVLVGTALDPSKSKRPAHIPGVIINTLWGEMAAQLADSAGSPKLYEYVKEADKKGVSPGSEALKNLFDECGSCMVLIDELVAYARKLYGVDGLPAGSFDNLMSFVQELTEAARASRNSLVVASLPESDIEIGGEAGKLVLTTIEHTFGRMESIWKPVAANEGFEVVRRRLFLNCKDPAGRELVCSRFSQMYNENPSDFPIEARELEYKQQLLSCYPIHPEVFDRLYEDWATLERFQRTRGVLRLMAAVIHDLWMSNDAGLLIMPGSLSLDNPNVRDELTRHLPENWNALVDHEVDGRNSIPYQKDQSQSRFGRILAARRVARAIMLGSAPSVKKQLIRGIEASRVRLGVVQPGESIAVFNDALGVLQTSLAYLYSNPTGDRFWYDTRPTLRKTVEDRASQIAGSDVEHEIEKRLAALRREPPFGGVHTCPGSSLDVPDDPSVRLVILRPEDTYETRHEDNPAMTMAREILDNRGTAPRICRNMLAFLAPDEDVMKSLKTEVRRFLAWKSIKNDSEDLNLDAAQNRETENNLGRSDGTIELRIREAYSWLLAPSIDRAADLKTVLWDRERISGGNDGPVTRAARRMIQRETLITKWAPALLLMELDNLLWKNEDSISIKKLWNYLCSYCYLPRLASYEVLEETIRTGLASDQYFALAEGVSDGRFLSLRFNQYIGTIDPYCCLVKVAAAKRQIEEERRKAEPVPGPFEPLTPPSQGGSASGSSGPLPAPPAGSHDKGSGETGQLPPVPPQPRRFYLSAKLDNTRINRDVSRLVDEIIAHITSLSGSQVEITLEVSARVPNGVSPNTVRTVTENCRTLRVDSFGFEEG